MTNVVQAAPELALTPYWFSNFLFHKSICKTVCSSASWHGWLKSKLTLFTAQLSNFDSKFFCPHSDISTSTFNQLCVYGCRMFKAPWGDFMLTPAPRSWQLWPTFYNLIHLCSWEHTTLLQLCLLKTQSDYMIIQVLRLARHRGGKWEASTLYNTGETVTDWRKMHLS